jgi:DNA repair photolyase
VLAGFRQAVTIVTKNRLVTRDLDVLGELAVHKAAGVMLSITTLDPQLAGQLEPRTSRPAAKLEAVRTLTDAGIPTGVMIAPVIPGLTEHEMPSILEAAAQAGATHASYVLLRLPMAVAGLFDEWLDRHRPGAKQKILGRIRATRDGRLNDSRFGIRMRGEGPIADLIRQVFHINCRRLALNQGPWPVSAEAFARHRYSGQEQQLNLFD